MLTELKIYGVRASAPTLPLTGDAAAGDPVQIKKIDGLGPVKANINTAPYGSSSGEADNGSSTGKRTFTITLGLNPNWVDQSVESLRMLAYAYFMPEETAEFHFVSTHLPTVKILGRIESIEPGIFTQDPELVITVVCPMPYFVAVSPTVVTGNMQWDIAATTAINYPGTKKTGFTLRIDWATPKDPLVAGWLEVTNSAPNPELFRVNTATINSTNVFRMSTVQGKKFVRSYNPDTNVETNLLGVTDIASEWLQLKPGLNNFIIRGALGPTLAWALTYHALYGGL